MTEQFFQITHEMLRATHWVSKTTGESFMLTGDQKNMWVWMESRYRFFRSLGNDWFDNQHDIAAATGCDPSTVKRFIAKLAQHGYIEVECQKGRGFIRSNRYKILAPLQVCVGKAPTSSIRVSDDVATPILGGGLDTPVIASQELTSELVHVFEDVPLEAYTDTPPQAPVVVHKRIQLLGEVPDIAAPVIKRRAVVECDNPLPW
ncbi:helix-turn-helix domain-containing protein [Pseudomonas sp. W4I3]|uniref:DUF6945 domain-containing protein n=1 Tax=Pseudomonas sp. W4I3 TaxID=3042294 RepID=UPI0027B8C1EB|nr:helix-turn-helix domain-containing protein [Pseudomonas sp. W4I3]